MKPAYEKYFVLASTLLTIFTSAGLPLLILVYFSNLYSRIASFKNDSILIVRELVTKESLFSLFFALWLWAYGQYQLEFFPIYLYSALLYIELHEQSCMISTIQRDRSMKESLAYLINNSQLYVLAYEIFAQLVGGKSGLVKCIILITVLKFKYGFNPYMQKIFYNTHISIMSKLVDKKILLKAYLILYRALGTFGRAYVNHNVRRFMGKKTN